MESIVAKNRTQTLVDQSDYPSKRFKCEYVNDIDEQLVAWRDSPKQPNPPSPPAPSPPIFRYLSEGQTPIYRGPSEGEGFRYLVIVGLSSGDYDYDHTIFFKGDSFTVRENRRLVIPDEERLKRPPEDKRIRSIRDPNNFDFLESLLNKQCPAEFCTDDRQGYHHIDIIGLGDAQDLEAPVIPPGTPIRFDISGFDLLI